MRRGRGRLLGACAAAAAMLGYATQAIASPASWSPGVGVLPGAAPVGLAANAGGGFLLLDGSTPGEAAFCPAGAAAFAVGGAGHPPGEPAYVFGYGGRVIPASPSFLPNGRSLAMYAHLNLHAESGEVMEGPSSAPAAIAPVSGNPGGSPYPEPFYSNTFAATPRIESATGPHGDVAVLYRPDSSGQLTIAIRLAGSAQWSKQNLVSSLQESARPVALAVDGSGNTTLLAPTGRAPGVEVASAWFVPAGGTVRTLSVPGNYFTAVGSDATGRSALVGYTAKGPDGPGLYLSRRESPSATFGAPVLLSSTSVDPHPQLAYDAAGNLTIAWSEGSRVAALTAAPGQPVGAAKILPAPRATIVSDEQLSVDAAGEAVLAWAAAPHEEAGPSGFGPSGLHGGPAPLWASVRSTASAQFQDPREVAPSAAYGEGRYDDAKSDEPRELDAISAGRAMVAWLEAGASGAEVKAALYAGEPGCAGPPQTHPGSNPATTHPAVPRPRVTRAKRPRRHGRTLILGHVSCPRGCTVTTTVLRGSPRLAIAHGRIRVPARGQRTLSATLTPVGLRLLCARPHIPLRVRVHLSAPAERPITPAWGMRLSR